MASYRPFPPPASSFPPPPASSNQNLLPPPPYPEQNLYPQHSNFAGGGGGASAPSNHSRNPPNVNSHHNYAPSTQSHQFSTSRTQQHSNRPPNHQQQHHHQHPPPQQYPHAPPPPPSSSYPLQPPPTQPSQFTPAPQQPPNMYYPPSSQHNPPPPSSPPPSHSLHPPPPPTASFPPPLNHSGSKPSSRHLSNKEAARPARPLESAKAPSLPLKQQKGIAAPPTVPSAAKPAHLANGPTGKVETEEERRIRKKREYEKLKQEEKRKQMMKQTQATVLQKTHMMKQAQPHGSLGGSRLADRRATPFLSGERAENRLKKPTTFLCKLKFRNELPDPTAQPKLLSTNTNKDRYAKYTITSLEKMHKPKLHPEPDLGIPLDLLDLSVYKVPDVFASLDPEDEELLRDGEIATPVKQESGIRRKDRPTDIGMHWLVKTQYISPLSMDSAKMSLTEKQAKEIRESKEGRNLFLEGLNSREKQIQAIEESFKAAKLPPVHQTKPHLRPEKIMPLLPDFSREEDQFVMVTFDGAPTADSEIYSKLDRCSRDEHESQAVMKSFVVNGSDPVKQEKFLAYMVPTPGELSKDIYDENEEMSYSWVREYHWDVRGDDATDPTTYLVNFDDDVARYLPLPTRLVLQKKKAKEGRSTDEIEHYPVPRSVTVRREGAFVEPKDNLKRGRYLRDDDDEARHKVPRMDDMDQYSGEEDIFE